MTKNRILFPFLMMLWLLPLSVFSGTIERYCFQDDFGSVYDVRGGKLGKKAYTVQTNNVFCPNHPLTGIATFAVAGPDYLISMMVSGDPFDDCGSYVVTSLIDKNLTQGTGNYDNLPRETAPDGTLTLNRITCPSSLKYVPSGTRREGSGAGSHKK